MELNFKNDQRGQTVVEYILLLSVAASLFLTFYNSETFKKLFGTQGQLGQQIKAQAEFSYRHAYLRNRPATDIPMGIRDPGAHPSYADQANGGTRFFGPKSPYGE
jgi:Flp pilus assembly pilin Flp